MLWVRCRTLHLWRCTWIILSLKSLCQRKSYLTRVRLLTLQSSWKMTISKSHSNQLSFLLCIPSLSLLRKCWFQQSHLPASQPRLTFLFSLSLKSFCTIKWTQEIFLWAVRNLRKWIFRTCVPSSTASFNWHRKRWEYRVETSATSLLHLSPTTCSK